MILAAEGESAGILFSDLDLIVGKENFDLSPILLSSTSLLLLSLLSILSFFISFEGEEAGD